MEKILIVANWKMNPQTPLEAKQLFTSVKRGIKNIKNIEIVICPPFVYIDSLKKTTGNLQLGSQNCFWEEEGAFTGEISPPMLKSLGVKYIIIGHSERRKYFKEVDETLNKKIQAALRAGLKPILCIDKISQIPGNIKGFFVVAYEPLFAIGTGKACSTERAKKMRLLIKKKIKAPVLYGGSVNSQNAKDYIKKAGFQGLLVGGASLKPREFIEIVKKSDQT